VTLNIEILDFGATSEAQLLRSILENLGARVGMTQAGNPSAFLQALSLKAHYLIICGHGDNGGFVFGEFAPSVDSSMLVDGILPAAAIEKAKVRASNVISTGCETGADHFVAAFRKSGAKRYIAPRHSPEGSAVPLIVHHYFHAAIVCGLDSETALEAAQSGFQPDDRFTNYPLR
jgi:hypothetical protein